MPLPLLPLILTGIQTAGALRNFRRQNGATGHGGPLQRFRERRRQRHAGQTPVETPPAPQPTDQPVGPQALPLPLTPPTPEEIANSLWFTGPLLERAVGRDQSDLVKGGLREVQKLSAENIARSGITGGLGDRTVTEAMLRASPQLWQTAQSTQTQDLNTVMQELALQNQLYGNISDRPTLDTARFLSGVSLGEAGVTGVYNPPFTYGLYPITQEQVDADNRRQRRSQTIDSFFNVVVLLRGLGLLPSGV